MTKQIILLTVILFLATACNACATTTPALPPTRALLKPGDDEQSLTHAGRTRTFTVHLPRGIGDELALPLVIVLHGGGGNGNNAARMTGFSLLADKEQFIVVYPDGTGRRDDKLLTWNAGNCCGYALDNQVDDVGFLRALIEKMQREYPIYPKRIYVTGMSNGAMMAHRFACEASAVVAAIAPVVGALNVACKPANPVSVIAFNGMQDEHVLFDGGSPTKSIDPHPRVDNSAADTMAFWAKHNRCALTPQHVETGNLIRDEYAGCANGASVVLYAIKNGGHAWPGGQRGSFLGDMPTRDLSATDVMWEFFKAHSKP